MNSIVAFLKQTAKDYDLELEIVIKIYNQSKSADSFYERLEKGNGK